MIIDLLNNFNKIFQYKIMKKKLTDNTFKSCFDKGRYAFQSFY